MEKEGKTTKYKKIKSKYTINNRLKNVKEMLDYTKIDSLDENPIRTLDFAEIMSKIGGNIAYMNSNTSSHTFISTADREECNVEIIPYLKDEKYGPDTNPERPENVQLKIAHLLSEFVINKQTPHINLPIGVFKTNINIFTELINSNVTLNTEKSYNSNEYYENAVVLISEFANRGNLLSFLKKNYLRIQAIHWKVLFFQILSVLAIIQNVYPNFKHNNLKANNILIHKTKQNNANFRYKVNRDNYKVPNVGYEIRLWNFESACIAGIINNNKTNFEWANSMNITLKQNRYYDIHYFFNNLIQPGSIPEIMSSTEIPQDVKDFIYRVVPEKYRNLGTEYVSDKGRILIDDEYTTPINLIKNDPYFEEFRVKDEIIQPTYVASVYKWITTIWNQD